MRDDSWSVKTRKKVKNFELKILLFSARRFFREHDCKKQRGTAERKKQTINRCGSFQKSLPFRTTYSYSTARALVCSTFTLSSLSGFSREIYLCKVFSSFRRRFKLSWICKHLFKKTKHFSTTAISRQIAFTSTSHTKTCRN